MGVPHNCGTKDENREGRVQKEGLDVMYSKGGEEWVVAK